ncbi:MULTISPECIES: hypothetical protein [unclassified Maridesulfovibrio]|uniref:hypothetical protein n=1 Tax=unclassified Maridesulfovibrio TaxID=2794999 RepID=UPI003B4006E6
MILNKIIHNIKSVIITSWPFLVFVSVYFVYIAMSVFFVGVTEYASVYTSSLFVSFALSCIACRDLGLKIIRFDFQFRMAFVYLTLLLINKLALMSASTIDNSFIEVKEATSTFILSFFPDIQYELSYKGSLGIIMESLFYGFFSPLIYSFACLCFSLKKILTVSVFNLLLGTLLLTINGIIFGALGLLAQVKPELYFAPFFAINFLMLIVLSYVVGKNSFAETENAS